MTLAERAIGVERSTTFASASVFWFVLNKWRKASARAVADQSGSYPAAAK
jgi:hypothetical protein